MFEVLVVDLQRNALSQGRGAPQETKKYIGRQEGQTRETA